jgi:hypothetical protein
MRCDLSGVAFLLDDWIEMNEMLRRVRRAVTSLGAEDRPEFKRVDASPALYDDGSWLTKRD